jgi:hypothetical protein
VSKKKTSLVATKEKRKRRGLSEGNIRELDRAACEEDNIGIGGVTCMLFGYYRGPRA